MNILFVTISCIVFSLTCEVAIAQTDSTKTTGKNSVKDFKFYRDFVSWKLVDSLGGKSPKESAVLVANEIKFGLKILVRKISGPTSANPNSIVIVSNSKEIIGENLSSYKLAISRSKNLGLNLFDIKPLNSENEFVWMLQNMVVVPIGSEIHFQKGDIYNLFGLDFICLFFPGQIDILTDGIRIVAGSIVVEKK